MNELTTDNSAAKKSFWARPEGKTGMIFIAAIAAVGFYFWGRVVPFILAAVQNTLYLGLMLGAVGIVAYFLLQPNVRAGFWYLFNMICRFFTSWVVNIDPIGIIKGYIDDLTAKRNEANQKINEVSGAREGLKRKVEANVAEMKQIKQNYDYGVANKADEGLLQTYAIRMGGLKAMNEKFIPMCNNLTAILEHLERMYKASGYMLEQMKCKVEMEEIEYKAVKSANKAMKSAMAVFAGDPSKKTLFDEALTNMADDMALKVGEMKRAIDLSSDYINNIDIESGAEAASGAKILEKFDSMNFTLLSVDDIKKNREQSKNSNVPTLPKELEMPEYEVLEAPKQKTSATKSKYSNL